MLKKRDRSHSKGVLPTNLSPENNFPSSSKRQKTNENIHGKDVANNVNDVSNSKLKANAETVKVILFDFLVSPTYLYIYIHIHILL